MKILVVDDEDKTSRYLEKGLTENGFIVDIASNGEDGLSAALSHSYDLVILDVMMPKRDGWSVLKDLRGKQRSTLTLFLSARDTVDDRVHGLDLGADAYLVKPFAFSELLAVIHSLLRRKQSRISNSMRIADLEIDFIAHKVFRAGKRVDLTPKEFSLISLFARRSDEILSRSMIASHVWDMNFDSDTNVVDVHIRRLRSKIDDGFSVKLIHTVRGMGYVLRPEG